MVGGCGDRGRHSNFSPGQIRSISGTSGVQKNSAHGSAFGRNSAKCHRNATHRDEDRVERCARARVRDRHRVADHEEREQQQAAAAELMQPDGPRLAERDARAARRGRATRRGTPTRCRAPRARDDDAAERDEQRGEREVVAPIGPGEIHAPGSSGSRGSRRGSPGCTGACRRRGSRTSPRSRAQRRADAPTAIGAQQDRQARRT